MKKPEKHYDTGLRILEVLKLLLEKDVSKNEIIDKLKDNNSINGVYTQEAFLKYFNTFEHMGLKLKKDKSKYTLENAILKTELTKKEKNIFIRLINSVEKLNNKKFEDIAKNVILRLDKYVNMDLKSILVKFEEDKKLSLDKNVKANVITTLKNMIYDNHKVTITYRKNNNTEETVTVILKEILEENNNVYVICYNSFLGRNRRINIDSIIEMKQLPNLASQAPIQDSVVFEVYGRLSSAYKLKASESVLNFSNNHQTISNLYEDRDALLLRLLKYGENCKIIKPLSMQKELLDMTNKILKNLEGEICQESH